MTTSIEEAITTYYQKKATYEREYERKKETIRKSDEMSDAEKREKIKNISRKCIVCESSEGTIFSQNGRTLSAICGNRANPCSLNINIERPTTKSYFNVDKQLNNSIEKLKNDVILSKYNILFNFSRFDDGFVNKADEIRKRIKEFDDLKKKYDELFENATRIEERKDKISKDEYDFLVKVGELKGILKESDTYPSAVEHYINIMLPMLNKIRETKYSAIDVVRETVNGDVLSKEDKSDKGENMRLIRDLISLNDELITVLPGSVKSFEYKKEKRAKPLTAKVKKTSSTSGTLKKKKLVVAPEPVVVAPQEGAEEISP